MVAALAFEHSAQQLSVRSRIATLKRASGSASQGKVLGRDVTSLDAVTLGRRKLSGTGSRDFVNTVPGGDDESVSSAERGKRLSHHFRAGSVIDTQQLDRRAQGIRQRPEQVEDRLGLESAARVHH